MKFSEAILKGYKTNGGKQCAGDLLRKADGAMCVMGAAAKGMYNDPGAFKIFTHPGKRKFEEIYGIGIVELNNGEVRYAGGGWWISGDMMPWEHIYGMAVAVDL